MNNEMENLMEEIEKTMVKLYRGDIVTGNVINVTKNEIFVNLGYKADGVIPRDEISNDTSLDPSELVEIGDEIKVYVMKLDDGEGNVLLSKKKVDIEKGWQDLEEINDSESLINTKVIEVVRGGVIALSKGIRCFIPASQLSDRYVDNLNSFIGESFDAKIIEFDRRKNKVVLSRRVVLEKEMAERKKEIFEELEVGKRIEGEIKQITNFGAFVDIGGIDGLIHISEISWGRVEHPSEILEIGDKLEVEVLDFDESTERISLSLKNTLPEPWEHVDTNYNEGDIVEGKVVKMLDFGAFVELEPGLDGLVHISQIREEHIAKPSDVLELNERVKVKILGIDKEAKRISLSILAALDEVEESTNDHVEDEEEVKIGDVLNLEIQNNINDEENEES